MTASPINPGLSVDAAIVAITGAEHFEERGLDDVVDLGMRYAQARDDAPHVACVTVVEHTERARFSAVRAAQQLSVSSVASRTGMADHGRRHSKTVSTPR
jgi:hypothetical protein